MSEQVSTIKVSSSLGHLLINPISGEVIVRNISTKTPNYLSSIKKFDVNRFKLANKTEVLPHDIDILRLAYWTIDDLYDKPAEHYEIVSSDPDFFNKLIDSTF